MLQEIFLGEKLQWPKPYRCAVNFVFNYQGAEGLEPDSKGRIDAEEYARREYGPRVGYGGFYACWISIKSRRLLLPAGHWPNATPIPSKLFTRPDMTWRDMVITTRRHGS